MCVKSKIFGIWAKLAFFRYAMLSEKAALAFEEIVMQLSEGGNTFVVVEQGDKASTSLEHGVDVEIAQAFCHKGESFGCGFRVAEDERNCR